MSEAVTIGSATLYCCDNREVLPLIPQSAAIVSDPPYGIGFAHSGGGRRTDRVKHPATAFAGKAVIGDDAPFDPAPLLGFRGGIVLWGANHYAERLPSVASWLVWDKRAGSGHSNSFADCELAWCDNRRPARMFRHHWDGAMRATERGVRRVHPTQKPIALMRWCLGVLGVSEGGLVADPYMGSGTTGVACAQRGIPFVGVEIDRAYFDIACRRIEEAQRQILLPLAAGV